ncbi:hypothetical protein [Streptomyces sp. NPDC006285]|uniref:hypothetical protein n=1 Tax=Streptomyces sp. NPDC006285 TaxID=3364742 RepID=UPI0036A29DCF
MAAGGMTAAALGAFIVFEDEAGFGMTAARARTWGRRRQTPLVRVRGRSWRRYSIDALCCYRPGESSRLIYRPRRHPTYRGKGRNSFAWTDVQVLEERSGQLQTRPPPSAIEQFHLAPCPGGFHHRVVHAVSDGAH